MSRRLSLSILILVVLTFAGSLAAQQNPPAQGQPPRRGMGGEPPTAGAITSVGVDRFEIKKDDGTTVTIMVNDQTRYREQQQQLALEDLKVGDHVMVRGQMNADKQLVAGMVTRGAAGQFQRGQGGGGFGGNPANRAGGEILSIDQNQIKVRGRQGERIIVVNDQTTFMKEGQAVKLKDLKAGDRIFATGKDVDGKFVATDVRSGHMGGGGGGGWRGGGPQQ